MVIVIEQDIKVKRNQKAPLKSLLYQPFAWHQFHWVEIGNRSRASRPMTRRNPRKNLRKLGFNVKRKHVYFNKVYILLRIHIEQ